jgi:hypothetical protein
VRKPLTVPLGGVLAKLGVLSSLLLAGLYVLAGPETPVDAAAATPHAAATCSQPGGAFASGSAVVGIAVTPDDGGYWIVNNAGQIAACGDAPYLGQPTSLNKPIVGIAATADGGGYYEVATDGGVFAYGDAHFQGSTGAIALNKPIVGMAVDQTTGGYWLVASDGGIFAYNAPFLGSTGSITLNQPVVGMTAANNGTGYWFVASDGGIFAYGVPFWGSTGAIHLNKPVVGMAVDPVTGGYWLVASDGGIFAFNAPFFGSTGSIVLNQPIVGMEASPSGAGYRFVAADGGVFAYHAAFYGTPVFGSQPAPTPTPTPTPTGSQATASFSCTGSPPTAVIIDYGSSVEPNKFFFVRNVPLPWSAMITVSHDIPGNTAFITAQPNALGSISCSTTVTWPGGSVTATDKAPPSPYLANPRVCTDYPNDSGWTAC